MPLRPQPRILSGSATHSHPVSTLCPPYLVDAVRRTFQLDYSMDQQSVQLLLPWLDSFRSRTNGGTYGLSIRNQTNCGLPAMPDLS